MLAYWKNLRWLRLLTIILAIGILLLAGVGVVSIARRLKREYGIKTPPSYTVRVPDGFTIAPYGEPRSVSFPTVITFGPGEKLYLLTLEGHIFTFEDRDGDAYAETVEQILDGSTVGLSHAVGLTFRDNVMYISDSGRVSTLTDENGDGAPDTLTPIVTGLPTLQYTDHSNNGIAFGPDGKLYIAIGGTTDHGPINDPLEARVMRVNPDGSELETVATGFRNPYDLTFSPSGDLFTADNNPSELDETLRSLPPEELNYVQFGKFYGFPEVYGNPPAGHDSEPPVVEFYPSVGSAGLVYYTAEQFPPSYRDGVFVVHWGTGAGVAIDRGLTNGQMVVFVPLEKTAAGTYRGDWQPFAEFNLDTNYRPIDVTVGPDGALYILEWQSGSIYRVTYDGSEHALASTPTPTHLVYNQKLIARGEDLYVNGKRQVPACITCHLLEDRTALGPSLMHISTIAETRIDGLSAADYIRQSILHPDEFIVPSYNAGYMPQIYEEYLNDEEIDALIAFVLSLEEHPPTSFQP